MKKLKIDQSIKNTLYFIAMALLGVLFALIVCLTVKYAR